MHDYRIQGQHQREDTSHSPPFRTSAKVRYATNPASPATRRPGNTYNVADMAPLLQAVRNAGANNVVILGAWRTQAR